MLSYDKKNNLLTIQQIQNIDMGDRFNLLKDLRKSFDKFIEKDVYDSLEVVNKVMEPTANGRRFTFRLSPTPGYGGDEMHMRVKATVEGVKSFEPLTIIDLPYMDNLGRLHFYDRTVKSLVNRIASSDDLSFDTKTKSLSMVLKKKTIKISCNNKSNNFKVRGRGSKELPMPQLIQFLSFVEEKGVIDVHAEIRNPILQKALASIPPVGPLFLPEVSIREDNTSGTGLVKSLREDADYFVSELRSSINEAVSIDRAAGEVLSRPVLSYHKGDYVTPAMLADFKKNRINKFYVQTIVPEPKKRITGLVGGKVPVFTIIPKGARVREFAKSIIPELQGQTYAVQDYRVPLEFVDLTDSYATIEVLEYLADMGADGVLLGDAMVPYYFETEIIGNGTCRYRDVYSTSDCEKLGIDSSTWLYYGDRPQDDKFLSAEDLVAIYSTLGFTKLRNVNVFMDRDRDFLKKVELADVSLSKALASVLTLHTSRYRDKVKQYMFTGVTEVQGFGIFAGCNKALKKTLNEMGVLAEPDRTNFIAELSQATHVTNMVREAPEVMRQIAMPYYGRLCPFETPEGKQLGLVNSKALGCHIIDGEMYVPVRKVIKQGDTVKISDTIEELSVKQEMAVRITDILQLTPGKVAGTYENTRVIAKVPNPYPSGDKMIYATVYATDLDYVYAHTEEFISGASALIPFACADDAVRVSFGSKMIKSAINLLDPDVPRVQTFMYRKMFESSDAYLIRAEENGTVLEVAIGYLTVQYDGYPSETVYTVQEQKVTRDSVNFMRYNVVDGSRFKKGDILADCAASQSGVYCTGKNTLVAYMPTGYNYEDAVHVSEQATVDFVSIGSTSITVKKQKDSKLDTGGLNKYYNRGDIVTTMSYPMRGEYKEKSIRTNHGSGIWYGSTEQRGNNGYEYRLDLMGYNKLQSGDKMSGRHGNKGTEAICWENSQMPMLANGTPVKIILNPLGSPSRMNIGQEYEAHLGLIAEVLGVNINSDPFNGATHEDVQNMMNLAYDLANANSSNDCRSISMRYGVPEDMIPVLENNMESIMSWKGTFDRKGDARLWNPETGKWFPFPVTIGVSYMMKMKQEVETKAHERAGCLEESYRVSTGQPPKGGKDGGQGLGEMEMWSLMAYGAANLLHSFYNDNSDNDITKCNMELSAMGCRLHVPERNSAPRAVTNVMYALEALGVQLVDDEDELPDTSYQESVSKFVYRVKDSAEAEYSGSNERELSELRGDDIAQDAASTIMDLFFK